MRKAALVVLAACAVLATVSTSPAKAKRYWVPRSGPEILVVPNGYGLPQVYVRRYEALVFEYVAARRYYVRRHAACVYPRRTVYVCKGYRRH